MKPTIKARRALKGQKRPASARKPDRHLTTAEGDDGLPGPPYAVGSHGPTYMVPADGACAVSDASGPVFHRPCTPPPEDWDAGGLTATQRKELTMNRTPTWAWIALAAVVILIAWVGYAYAQEAVVVTEDTTIVTIPWALWLEGIKDIVIAIAVAGLAWIMRHLPAHLIGLMKMFRVEQMIGRAIENAINSVAGASKDKPLTVDLGNAVVARSVQYIIDKAPEWMVEWTGGQKNLREMVIARLDLDPESSVEAKGGELVINRKR